MSTLRARKYQSGVALATTLIFLLIVTVIAVTAASSSAVGLKMTANMQDTYRSFQAAEAGIYAAFGLAGSSEDPFDRRLVVSEPFQSVTAHPLRNLAADPNNVPIDVDVHRVAIERQCPRPSAERGGSSSELFDCDFYRITSEHDAPQSARSQVELGVIKTVIAGRG